jgi:hypothetical protein
MDEAIVVLGRKGLFRTVIRARDIRSREHARKLWPFVSAGGARRLVSWVSPSFSDDGKLRRRSHFRIMPKPKAYDLQNHLEREEERRQQANRESSEHLRAKDLIAAELNRRLTAGTAMPWSFEDKDASDFPFVGDLLVGAEKISIEHSISTPFGFKFRLDIAVLGPPIDKVPMILGGIEIELDHSFDGHKALIGRSLGYPLISVDIEGLKIDQITSEWAKQALTKTTGSHEQVRRFTYVYLHELLYPLYAQIPRYIDEEQRHQFLVFSDDAGLEKLPNWLNILGRKLSYPDHAIAISLVNGISEQSRRMLQEAGKVVGPDWINFNQHKCLRITAPRPQGPNDVRAHKFHMTLARLLISDIVALVGYKYCKRVQNYDPEDDLWVHDRWIAAERISKRYRILPKRLGEPISQLLHVIEQLLRQRQAESVIADVE